MVSPGDTGVVAPAISVVGPASAPVACVAAMYLLPVNQKNAGAAGSRLTLAVALIWPLLLTCTSAAPAVALAGIRKSTCEGPT